VWGCHGTSWKYNRLRFVTRVFQISQCVVERQMDEPTNVFTKHPSGPEFAYNSKHFRPEEAVIILALSLPGDGEWLTRESSGE